jgi:hypothetical protein
MDANRQPAAGLSRFEKSGVGSIGADCQLDLLRTARAITGVRRCVAVDVNPRIHIAALKVYADERPLGRQLVSGLAWRPVFTTRQIKIFAGHSIALAKCPFDGLDVGFAEQVRSYHKTGVNHCRVGQLPMRNKKPDGGRARSPAGGGSEDFTPKTLTSQPWRSRAI